MSFVIGNVKKFIKDHPELKLDEGSIIKQAEEMTEPNSAVIVADIAEKLFGPLTAQMFFAEIESTPEHIQIWAKTILDETP